MKKFGWQQWLVVLAFVLVVSFTGMFAVRTVRRAIYWHYHQDEPIRAWMSLGYVAHSYNVPPGFCVRLSAYPKKLTGRTDARSGKLPANRIVQSTK